ncbi:MAG: hypothetical protein LLG37_00970 [Spirochaetia bacterium]|nr:hypothetical protein [Spirochaetia bacterium]
MRSCSIFFSPKRIVITANIETPDGGLNFGKPTEFLKHDPAADELGRAIIKVLKAKHRDKPHAMEILKEAGFESWKDFSAASHYMTAEMSEKRVIIRPYFSGIDGEYYEVMNREKNTDTEPFEVGHAAIRLLEYCG